ncbi:ras GEF [Phlegmacium glaucopus]|nr:ras GEF [Phlegmacium glaucopus]
MAPQASPQFPVSPTPYSPLSLYTPSFSDSVTSESDDTHLQSESVVFSVLCMFDFTSPEAGILSFKKNEILDIVKCTDGGWWAAMRKDGCTLGWIPQTFVNPLSEEMAERLWDIREELRGAEFKRVKELSHSAQDTTSLSAFVEGSSLKPEGKDFANLYNDHAGELLDIRKAQNVVDSPQSISRYRSSSTTSTHHRHLARSASTKINPPSSSSPQSMWTDDSRIRAGSLSITVRSPRRQPVIVDDDATLSRISTLIRSTNSKQNDNIPPSNRENSQALSNVVKKQVQEDRPQRKFSEGGVISFECLSSAVKKNKAQQTVLEAGPVIDIGHPQPESTPWHLRPKYADQLDIDKKGGVRTGSLSSLFEVLTTDPSDASELARFNNFTDVFLMTFRTFTTADHLFDMLVERFHLEPEISLTELEYVDWKSNHRNPVQRLVLKVFKIWLTDYHLLEEEPHIAPRLRDFLTQNVYPPHRTIAITIIQTIDRLTSNLTCVTALSFGPKKARKFKINKLDLFKLDPKSVAEQLTLYESGLYVKITPHQCLTYVRNRTGNDVAQLRDFCSTHDKLAAWVKMSILNSDATGRRALTIDFWIKVAEKCRALNNISSMSAIITALSSTVITGLHLTWGHTSRKTSLDSLLRYSEPTGGFAGYRSLLQQAEGPCVPFITMFLTEMVHVQDQFSETEGRISFYQRTRWYEIITAMLRFQSRPYSIAVDEPTAGLIESHLREGSCCDPGWFWKRSQEIQKAEVTHADIRKGLEAAGF